MAADFSQIIQQLMQIPGASELFEGLLQSAFGAPGFGLRYTSYDPTKTLEFNAEQARRNRVIQNQLYSTFTQMSSGVTTQAMTNLYRTLGFDQAAAKAAAGRSQGGFVHDALNAFVVQPQLKAAYNSIAGALYDRSAQWDPSAVNSVGLGKGSYWQMGQRVLEDVIRESVNQQYGGMNPRDAGKIAAELIGNGALDVDSRILGKDFAKDTKAVDRFNTERINNFKRELKSYAESIHMLQDVIEGPVEDILDSFESLTGNRMVSMSTGRVESLSSQLRNVLAGGRVSMQQLSGMVAQQYGMIAPLGGSMQQAAAMGIANAAALTAGHRIEGLSDQELNASLMTDNAQKLVSGELRNIAAAYQHWRGTGPNMRADTVANKERFFAMMRATGMSLSDAAADYIQKNNVSAAFMGSGQVAASMADASFITASRLDYVDRFNKSIDSAIRDAGVTDSNKAATVKRILSTTKDLTRVQEELRRAGFSQTDSANIYQRLADQAMYITGAENERAAMGMIQSAVEGDNQTRKAQASDYFRKIKGIKTADGLAGVLGSLMADQNDKGFGLTQMFGAFMGLGREAMMENAAVIENAIGDKTGKDAADAALNALAAQMGVSRQDLEGAVTDAKKLGDTSALALLQSRVVDDKGQELTGKEAFRRKSNALRMLIENASAGMVSKADREMVYQAHGLQVDARTDAMLALQQRGYGEVTDKVVDRYMENLEKARNEFKGERSEDELEKIATARTKQKSMGEAAFAAGVAKGDLSGAIKDLAKDTAFQAQVNAERQARGEGVLSGDTAFEEAAKKAIQQDGMMGLVQQILTAVLNLGGRAPANGK